MWNLKESGPRCICHLLVALVGLAAIVHSSGEIKDFIAVNTLPDGEVETRIYYGGVSAKEIAVGKGSDSYLKFRQLTNGKRLIQLIYDGEDSLQDCEIVHQRDQVRKFLFDFRDDLSKLVATSNLTVESLDRRPLPIEFKIWFDYTRLRDECRRLHHRMKKTLEEIVKSRNHTLSTNKRSPKRRKRSMLILPGTLWCGQSDIAGAYTKLGVMSKTDRCCRRHDHCRFGIPSYTIKYGYYNHAPYTVSHCHCDARNRRDITDLLRVPGTKWCGKGYSADKYTRLGGFSRTDKCCRRHDLSCPFWIGAFETKYGLFNWRVNTIMHCSCDERFRACLKMVDSSDANLVGKLFFNVVQGKCFVLKPKKKCVRTSWWGKCEKFRYEKQAILRDNLPY